MNKKTNTRYQSKVEKNILAKTQMLPIYEPTEKIKTLIVDNFPELGKVVALRFIEWAQQNTGSTISLPTGKTPEHFIKWVTFLLDKWDSQEVRAILEEYGVEPAVKPDMRSFHFVQIDEFYPIDSSQHNSFYHYVDKFYIKGFGLDPEKALLINPNEIGLETGQKLEKIWPDHIVDLSLRVRYPKNNLEEKQKRVIISVDQFATEYESKIRKLGGIGFFLGGIGPDGHIGFNVQGADHYSTTRLTNTNYETQAAAASDLGGIEISRSSLVITVGLQTISYSSETTAIIIAAGEAKANIVKQAIESPKCNQVPASILQELPNAAFYLTTGAAKHLLERRHLGFEKNQQLSNLEKKIFLTDIAFNENKKLTEVTSREIRAHRSGKLLLKKLSQSLRSKLEEVEKNYKNQIITGLEVPNNQVFLHTAPHHDDIMLGYLPYLVRLMREHTNRHYFNYLTSGFNAVTNSFMLEETESTRQYLLSPQFNELISEIYFESDNRVFRNRDVYQYLDGLAANDEVAMKEGAARRYLRCINEIYSEKTLAGFIGRLDFLSSYFKKQYPGKKDTVEVQKLKGMVREWEADVLWGYFGFHTESVIHSRLGFYKGDIFTEDPEFDRDVLPIVETLRKVQPTVVTVALDPEGSGPDTHYKVLQAISSALRIYVKESGQKNIKVWGYRNVWYRYHPAEANLFVPVTFNGMAILEDSFLNSFLSQADASFPSYEYDGPFSGLAKRIHVQQYQYMKTILGRDFFYMNEDSRIRSARGFVYLKTMGLEEFFEKSRELRKTTETVTDIDD